MQNIENAGVTAAWDRIRIPQGELTLAQVVRKLSKSEDGHNYRSDNFIYFNVILRRRSEQPESTEIFTLMPQVELRAFSI